MVIRAANQAARARHVVGKRTLCQHGLFALYAACLRVRPNVHATTFMLSMAVLSALCNLPFASGAFAFDYRLQAVWLSPGTAASTLSVRCARSAVLHTIPLFSALLARHHAAGRDLRAPITSSASP
jgi:hypothetical protein